MGLFNSKPEYQVTLEKKIKALREVGMNASADRLELQLKTSERSPKETTKPMSSMEMKKKVKEQQAMGQMKV